MNQINRIELSKLNRFFNEIKTAVSIIDKKDDRVFCSRVLVDKDYLYTTNSRSFFRIEHDSTIEPGVYEVTKSTKTIVWLESDNQNNKESFPDFKNFLNDSLKDLSMLEWQQSLSAEEFYFNVISDISAPLKFDIIKKVFDLSDFQAIQILTPNKKNKIKSKVVCFKCGAFFVATMFMNQAQ